MILCSGAFDGLHSGHIAYLEAAKALGESGEPLWVAVAPDTYIRLRRTPRWRQDERCRAVAALRVVDLAYVQDGDSVAGEILSTGPRLFVKGDDWRDQLPAEVVSACERVGATIVYTDTAATHNTEAFA